MKQTGIEKTASTEGDASLSFDKEDEYQRKPVAEKVIRLLTSGIDVSPMVIDGGWGAGKTRFCRKLITLFNETHPDYRLIYVDAFRADHADEPLMTLLAAVLNHLPETEQEPLIKKAIPIVRFLGKVALKAASGILLKQTTDEINDGWEKAVEESSDKAIDHAVESLLKDHVKARRNVEILRNALAELAAEIPIVIFVDELDRCRPDFAVSMLENIKHVFNVDGVKFVLVANMDQLRASITHRYGIGHEAQRYLDKFVGFSFSLPRIFRNPGYGPMHASMQHFHELVKSSDVLCESAVAGDEELVFSQELIVSNQRSLREVESFVRYLEILHTLTEKNAFSRTTFGLVLLRIFAVYLFCFRPDIRKDIDLGVYDAEELIGVLGKSRVFRFGDDAHFDHRDFMVALIALEANANRVNFQISEGEQETQWKSHIKEYFRDPAYGGRRGRGYVEGISEVFRTLELGKP